LAPGPARCSASISSAVAANASRHCTMVTDVSIAGVGACSAKTGKQGQPGHEGTEHGWSRRSDRVVRSFLSGVGGDAVPGLQERKG
jgi:hypothetical protein